MICYSVAYSDAVFIGLVAGLVSIVILRLQTGFLLLEGHDIEVLLWVELSHVTGAILVVSAINLLRALAFRRTRNAFILDSGIVGLVVFAGLGLAGIVFVQDSLSLHGWAAWSYSILLAVTVTAIALAILEQTREAEGDRAVARSMRVVMATLLVGLAIYVLTEINLADDWNGVVHEIFAVVLWVALAMGICRARSLQKRYRVGTIVVVAALTLGLYEALNLSEPMWAAEIGRTTTHIQQQLNNYSVQNVSFRLG